jgi:hypothetical protein
MTSSTNHYQPPTTAAITTTTSTNTTTTPNLRRRCHFHHYYHSHHFTSHTCPFICVHTLQSLLCTSTRAGVCGVRGYLRCKKRMRSSLRFQRPEPLSRCAVGGAHPFPTRSVMRAHTAVGALHALPHACPTFVMRARTHCRMGALHAIPHACLTFTMHARTADVPCKAVAACAPFPLTTYWRAALTRTYGGCATAAGTTRRRRRLLWLIAPSSARRLTR